ncbi:glycine C-acetyltransferase [Caballeronia hypogeia]|uniref:Glycine C-acetyltransferase n=1 Tax=Caballeronia hypogeia TaxID=1777140 RepID=A0A158AFR5_9BURK|nr:aminotransferase class I/II-fold pyridoxal phosphate-dependent enzyme [Caballeronia hypogeia]SAK56560.1 glycine C-acetyltransferase [Caballeronia hypogeia]
MSESKGSGLPGLTSALKNKLIQQTLERKLRQAGQTHERAPLVGQKKGAVPEAFTRFDQYPGYRQLRIMNDGAARLGVRSPFFKLHEGTAGADTSIGGRSYVNFASYNYLGMSGDPVVTQAAKDAIDRYGTSVSASRLVSGERPIHRELESALAELYGVDDAITFVSGHAANVTTIGYLFGPRDLVVHDELIHNSVLQGIQLAGAKRLSFAHNDADALDALLLEQRHQFERVLIVVEGIYSMDGDFPDLPRLVDIKRRHQAFLMVDEAHSLGVMGKTGRGIREHFGMSGDAVDIWMGTLSKTLAGCGGYIAGETALIEHLKFLAPGFLYSVGMPPPVAAASLAALKRMLELPERVETLQARGKYFLERAKAAGIDTGTSAGIAVVPAILGSSLRATRWSGLLFEEGFNVQPILYPAVPEQSARLRFFIACTHGEREIDEVIASMQRMPR